MCFRWVIFLTGGLLWFSTTLEAAGPRDVKEPVPDAVALKSAEQRLRELYAVDFLGAAKNVDLRDQLAQKLLRLGQTTQDDAVAQYAALFTARNQAAAAADIDLALAAVVELEKYFVLDTVLYQQEAVEQSLRSATTPTQFKAISDAAWTIGQTAAAQDRLPLAEKICEAGRAAADKSKRGEAVDQWRIRRQQLAELKLAAPDAAAALATLQQEPRDAAANAVVGRYRCLFKGDWPGGLLCLARGNDDRLRRLAQVELLGPADAAARLQLANDWWQYGAQQLGLVKVQALRRAGYWYEIAGGDLEGINKDLATQRAKSALAVDPATTIFAHTPLFWPDAPLAEVRRAAAEGTMYACGDHSFEMALNGRPILEGRRRPVAKKVTLKIGDILTVKVNHDRDERGFLCYWQAEDQKAAFFSNISNWHWYVPDGTDKWMWHEPKAADPYATLGHPNYLRIDEAAGWGAEPLWGPDSAPVFLYHVVSERDLAEIRGPALPFDREKHVVRGKLYLCADDACDVMHNGRPLGHARIQNEVFDVALAPGDILAVKAINMQFERGVVAQFVSADGQAMFVTQTATWHSYVPGEPGRWWLPRQAAVRQLSVRGDPRHLKLDGPPPIPREAIWGQDKHLSFLFHEVTEVDLQPRKK